MLTGVVRGGVLKALRGMYHAEQVDERLAEDGDTNGWVEQRPKRTDWVHFLDRS